MRMKEIKKVVWKLLREQSLQLAPAEETAAPVYKPVQKHKTKT